MLAAIRWLLWGPAWCWHRADFRFEFPNGGGVAAYFCVECGCFLGCKDGGGRWLVLIDGAPRRLRCQSPSYPVAELTR